MSVWDAITKTGEVLNRKLEEQNHLSKLKEYKKQMLQKLSTQQLKNITDHFVIDPRDATEIVDLDTAILGDSYGQKRKPKKQPAITRDDYIIAIQDGVISNELIEYCRKRGFREIEVLVRGRQEYMQKHHIDDSGKKLPIDEEAILEQPPKIRPSEALLPKPEGVTETYEPPSLVGELIPIIKAIPRLKKFKGEDDFHLAMLYHLENKYPNRVTDEADRGTVDILVDNVAIELKHFDNRPNNSGEISRLIGQMAEFADNYDAFVIVIYGGTEKDRQRVLAADKSTKHNVSVVLL